MAYFTIDYQDVLEQCTHCDDYYTVSRGSVYDEGVGASIYLAALHACNGNRVAHIAIAIRAGYEDVAEKCAAVLQVRNRGENFDMSLEDPQDSPWNGIDYLGRILTRLEVLGGGHKDIFFHLADYLVVENPTMNTYLSGE